MVKQAVILAGGKGRRLKDVSGDVPKPMVCVGGKPVLEHQIELLAAHGVSEVILLLGYNPGPIVEHFGDGGSWNIGLRCIVEDSPLGTAGAVAAISADLEDVFLVLYGDTMLNVDLKRMVRAHHDSGAALTLFVHPNDHPEDSDVVDFSDSFRVSAVHSYPHPEGVWLPNQVNAALYVVSKSAMSAWPAGEKGDVARDLLPLLLGRHEHIHAYCSPEYIKDMGTAERFKKVVSHYETGRIAAGSLATSRPAIFIDRDGTLIREVDGLTSPDQLELIGGVPEAIQTINRSMHLAVMVTNQPVIAKGFCTEDDLRCVHNKLATLLGRDGAYVDATYICLHHPDRGFPGERLDLKIPCECRKPGTGLIDMAVGDLNISKSDSWLVGDTSSDMLTAQRAGIRSVLVRTGYGGRDGKYAVLPDFECFDLADAVHLILDVYPAALREAHRHVEHVEAGDLILVGGLARSGKSILTGIVRQALMSKGLQVTTLSLDRWIRDAEHRPKPDTVRSRFDYVAAYEAIRRLMDCLGEEQILPSYDRMTSRATAVADSITVGRHDVVIVEGVPALDIAELKKMAKLSVFVVRPDDSRREAFLREYAMRGRSAAYSDKLYREREAEETPAISATQEASDWVWENPI